MPVLGICRGMQLLNVARGGTLDQHLPERSARVHRHTPGAFGDHEVRLEPGSLAARAVGRRARRGASRTTTRASTSSARGWSSAGWSADDELVEAIELPGPARSRSASSGTRRRTSAAGVIGSLVDEARERRCGRA